MTDTSNPSSGNKPANPSIEELEARASIIGPPTSLERKAAVGLLFLLVILFAGVLFRGEAIDPSLFIFAQTLVALVAAAAAAVLGGFVRVKGEPLGVGFRAGGAIGAFILVFWLVGFKAPKDEVATLPPLTIAVQPLNTFDLRTHQFALGEKGTPALTLSIGFSTSGGSEKARGASVVVQDLDATLTVGSQYLFLPYHLTTIGAGREGQKAWLNPLEEYMQPAIFEPNTPAKQIAFYPNTEMRWGQFVGDILKKSPGTISVTLSAKLNGSNQTTKFRCQAEFSDVITEAKIKMEEQGGKLPMRLRVPVRPECVAS